MTALAISLAFEPLRSIAAGSISPAYTAIGTPFVNPSRQIYIVNATDVLLFFSLDGVNDHFVIPAGSYLLNDISSNKTRQGGAFNISANTTIYVAGSPSMNSVYLTTAYGING